MQELVDDTLAFARASFTVGPNDIADLSPIVRKEYETRKALGENFTLAGAAGPLMVSGSSVTLTGVVSNLVSNAITYGRVSDISLLTHEVTAELSVADRGPLKVIARRSSSRFFGRRRPEISITGASDLGSQ